MLMNLKLLKSSHFGGLRNYKTNHKGMNRGIVYNPYIDICQKQCKFVLGVIVQAEPQLLCFVLVCLFVVFMLLVFLGVFFACFSLHGGVGVGVRGKKTKTIRSTVSRLVLSHLSFCSLITIQQLVYFISAITSNTIFCVLCS